MFGYNGNLFQWAMTGIVALFYQTKPSETETDILKRQAGALPNHLHPCPDWHVDTVTKSN